MTLTPNPPPSDADQTLPLPGGSGAASGAGLPPSAPRSSPSARIGRYELLAELGRGGMGIVYRARDPSLAREVAVKVVSELGSGSAEQVARFAQEARAAAKLHHRGIVAVHEVGSDAGRPFIVMDLVPGEPLDRLRARDRLPPRRVAAIVREVALALDHAHAAGVIHRDVKPQNVMIDPDGHAVLMDFGLARDTADASGLTATGQVLGTPAYMAPEQADGSLGDPSPATDVYALGGLLYHGLTGRPPFEGDGAVAIIKHVLLDEPVPPSTIDADVHPDLERIALRCLEKEAEHRYPSADEVAADLGRFLAGEAIRIRPLGRGERARRFARRHRGAIAAALVVGLVATGAAIAATVAARRSRDAQQEAARSVAAIEAAAAGDAFRRARAALPDGALASASAVDDALGLGLDASSAAERVVAAGGGEPARREAHALALATGRLALERGRFAIARSSFRKALETGLDDGDAEAGLREVDVGRDAAERRRRDAVAAILDRARSGEIAATGDAYQDALFELVGWRDPRTAADLAAALDEIAAACEAATTAALRAAELPIVDGEGDRIDGLAEALDPAPPIAWDLASRPDTERTPLGRAARRLVARERTAPTPRSRTLLAILGDAQEARLGKDRGLRAATLAAEALGRLGLPRDDVLAALERHLRADHDPNRAAVSALALCRLDGPRAAEIVYEARRRFGSRGAYWSLVGPSARQLDRAPTGGQDERRALGARLVERAEFARGAELLETYLRDRPDDAGAWLDLGFARNGTGDLSAGLEAIERALELAPTLLPAVIGRAQTHANLGALEASLADWSRVIAAEPNVGEHLASRAIVRGRLGDLDGAEVDVTRAAELAPDLGFVRLARGMILAIRGDVPAGIDELGRALELDANIVQAWVERARMFLALGDPDRARADLDRAVELDPANADARIQRARLDALSGRHERAIGELDLVIMKNERRASAWGARGEVRMMLGDPETAEPDLDRAIELAPSDARSWVLRARARRLLGRLDEARADVERAIELAPKLAGAHAELGSILRTSRDLRGAARAFAAAIELEPERSESWTGRALCRRDLGQHAAAIEDFDRAIDRRPANAELHRMRGWSRHQVGDHDGAIADLDRTIELSPRDAGAFSIRGLAHQGRGGDLARARADHDRAVELGPTWPPGWLRRARLLDELGIADEAAASYRRFLELAPGSPQRAAIEARIHALEPGR